MSKATFRGQVVEMGTDYELPGGSRFCGFTMICRGEAYLIPVPIEQLPEVKLYTNVEVTIEQLDQLPARSAEAPVPDDARDAKRYRYLREHPSFNRGKCRLEWYLPRWFAGDGSTGNRLDQSIDAEIKQQGG